MIPVDLVVRIIQLLQTKEQKIICFQNYFTGFQVRAFDLCPENIFHFFLSVSQFFTVGLQL